MNVLEELQKAKVDIAVKQLSELAQLIALTEDQLKERLADPVELEKLMRSIHYTRHGVYHLLDDERRDNFDKHIKENAAHVADQIINTIEKVMGKKQ